MAIITTGPAQIYIGTGGAWQGWNQAYVTTTSTTTAGTWANWNQNWSYVGTTTGSMTTWIQWNSVYTQAAVVPAVPVEQTPDQRAEFERRELARREEWDRRRQEQEREREEHTRQLAEARTRAEELLTALLTDGQAATWREHDWFTVRGSRTGRTYRIRRGIAGNVDLMADYVEDEAEVTYCAHPPGIPAEDVCLAQLFLLCTDEDAFLRVANVSRRHTVRQRPRLAAVA